VKILIDTDILSMFAKAHAVATLVAFLGQAHVAVTPGIRDEIAAPLRYGYTFPREVLSQVPVVLFTERVWQAYERVWAMDSSLGKGELEAIAWCRVEPALFVTNDTKARQFAEQQGVTVISLQALLRGLWRSGTQSKAEVQALLERIKEADQLVVPPEVEREIFDEENDNEPNTPA
jgi:predicted nucleic acid-binding protein